MIHEISTTEFIAGIANDRYDENDIVKYCSGLSNINAFWGALLVEHSRMIAKGKDTIVSFAQDAEITGESSVNLSPDDECKVRRIYNAISIVEELMRAQADDKEPQHGKENAIEQYITSTDKETTIKAIKNLVCGKKGKQAAVYIAVAVIDGYMSKPTFDILKEAFGIVGTKQAFNNAYNLYADTQCSHTRKSELDAARAALKRAIEGV